MSDSMWLHRWQPARLLCPWDSPGKNTGVGCYFLLQCRKWKVKVKWLICARLLATPWTAAYQAPRSMGSCRHGVLESSSTWSTSSSGVGCHCLLCYNPLTTSNPLTGYMKNKGLDKKKVDNKMIIERTTEKCAPMYWKI